MYRTNVKQTPYDVTFKLFLLVHCPLKHPDKLYILISLNALVSSDSNYSDMFGFHKEKMVLLNDVEN